MRSSLIIALALSFGGCGQGKPHYVPKYLYEDNWECPVCPPGKLCLVEKLCKKLPRTEYTCDPHEDGAYLCVKGDPHAQ